MSSSNDNNPLSMDTENGSVEGESFIENGYFNSATSSSSTDDNNSNNDNGDDAVVSFDSETTTANENSATSAATAAEVATSTSTAFAAAAIDNEIYAQELLEEELASFAAIRTIEDEMEASHGGESFEEARTVAAGLESLASEAAAGLESLESANNTEEEAEAGTEANNNPNEKRQQLLQLFLKRYEEWVDFQNLLSRLEKDESDYSIPRIQRHAREMDQTLVRTMLENDIPNCMATDDDGDVDAMKLDNDEQMMKTESNGNQNEETETLAPSKAETADEVGGKGEAMRPSSSSSIPTATATATTDQKALSLETLSHVLFRPGMKYRGKIRIPGLGVSPAGTGDDLSLGSLPDLVSRSATNDHTNGNSEDDNTDDNDHSDVEMNLARVVPDPHDSVQSNMENTYELIITEHNEDALGNKYILARHRAYGDEQCVHICMNIKTNQFAGGNAASESGKNNSSSRSRSISQELEIEYEDGETVCKGRWDPKNFRFEGHVCQRAQVNDGVFHARDTVTHVFTLYPCTSLFPRGRGILAKATASKMDLEHDVSEEDDLLSVDTRALVAHRRRTYTALFDSLRNYNELYHHMDIDVSELNKLRRLLVFSGVEQLALHDDKLEFLCKLRNIKWGEILLAASMIGEQTCAEFRRRAMVLDKACFETRNERVEFLGNWKNEKMDLAGAHSQWNECEALARSVACLSYVLNSSLDSRNDMYPIFAMSNRLYSNYDCLENAYRRAEARLPNGDLTKYEISPHIQQNKQCSSGNDCFGDESDCAICQVSLFGEDDAQQDDCTADPLYKLPCSHCFHGQCVRQWLHDHSSCPVCRFDLAKEVNEVKVALKK